MWKNASLAAKLIILIISSAAALIFAAVLEYNYQTSKATVLREMKENARNLTWKTVYQIDAILNSIEKVPEGVRHFPGMQLPAASFPGVPSEGNAPEQQGYFRDGRSF